MTSAGDQETVVESWYTLIVRADMGGRKACSGLRGVKLFDTYKWLLYKDIESRFKRCTDHYDRRQTARWVGGPERGQRRSHGRRRVAGGIWLTLN